MHYGRVAPLYIALFHLSYFELIQETNLSGSKLVEIFNSLWDDIPKQAQHNATCLLSTDSDIKVDLLCHLGFVGVTIFRKDTNQKTGEKNKAKKTRHLVL